MNVGSYIKQLRTERNMTQEELGQKIGVKRAAVQKWECGRVQNLKRETIQKLSEIFNVSPSSFIDGDDKTLTPYNPIVHRIPILGYISAGLPLYADEHIIDYTYTEYNGGAEYFALKVKGDSMSAAQINDGNTIIVRKQEYIENGEIAVVRVGNENATVKRFKQDGNIVQLIPQSFNPQHEIQFYDLKDTEVVIIGKVVECKIEF